MHPLVHGGRRDLSRWAGDEGSDELLWGCNEKAVKLFIFADACECTCVHCTELTRDAHERLCTHWVERTWVWS